MIDKVEFHSEKVSFLINRIDVTYAIELFEEFVLSVFAGQVMTKPIPNISPSSYEQVRRESLFPFHFHD